MNENEASQIIASLKRGLCFIQDDQTDSLVTRWKYDKADNMFVMEQQDTITGYLLDEVKYKEEALVKILLNEYNFKNLKSSYRKDGGLV